MDHYYNYGKSTLDWESFAISVALTAAVSLIVYCIISSILKKDFEALNTLRLHYRSRVSQVRSRVRTVTYDRVDQRDPAAPLRREAVWKKLQGDVFRSPQYPLLFSLLIGAGIQVLCTMLVVIAYSIYDFYIDKGALVGIASIAFPLFGWANSYTAARFYTFFHGSSWTMLAVCTSLFLPGFIASGLCLIDVCEWIETGHSDSVPVREAAILTYYWVIIQVPMAFIGAYLGFV